jgi:hypothetical protein
MSRSVIELLVIIILVFLAYRPVKIILYAPSGDDQKVFWAESTHKCCDSSLDTKNWQYTGRFLESYAANLSQFWIYEISDLSISCLGSILFACFGICLIFNHFLHIGIPSGPALITSSGMFLLPGVVQGIMLRLYVF